ncbi:MAG: F0F1 ATP synthase subunit B, partial [Kiritimatiellae bacterium]|nr:F0F1 ATP synthase subunit B [Kiritimatiellia bacterium]
MNIDWFTVIAQAINFIVLLWLMKHFLYKPILNGIDEREKRIAEKLESAETKKEAAEQQKEEYERKKEELNQQSTSFLKKAQDEGHAEKTRLMKEAREAAEAFKEKRQKEFVAEETTLREAVSRRIQNEVLAVTRKILTDLGGANLDEQVVGVFNQRLRHLEDSEIKTLTSALKTQSGRMTLRSAFDLSPELQTSTEAAIKETFGTETKVSFESAPDLISGIELSVNGQKVAWSVADYLSSIEEGLD